MPEDLKAYFEEKFRELKAEIAELRAEVARLKGGPGPLATPPSLPTRGETASPLSLALEGLEKEAPAELVGLLKPGLRTLQKGQLADKHQAQVIVELVELCEESRRSADLSHPFYDNLEERLQQLTSHAAMEVIQPGPGEAYRPSEHLILRTIRGEGARDTVERCLKRGFRFQGQLLKKAEVSVFL